MKKRKYERPLAMDLSGATAQGQITPNSTCANGSQPGNGSCLGGFLPLTTSVCTPTGSAPYISGCATGLLPTPVRCTTGSVPSPS